MRARPAIVVTALVLFDVAASARAARAQANFRSAPSGGRSALMGDTGVALARDGAAPFLNPATVASIQDSDVSFSVIFYRFRALHLSGWHRPGPVDAGRFGDVRLGDASLTTSRLEPLPPTICLFFGIHGFGDLPGEVDRRTGRAPMTARQRIALCLGTVESDEERLPTLNFRGATGTGVAQQAQSFTHAWSRLQLGPSYSARLTPELSVGASFHLATTTAEFANTGTSITTGTPIGAIASEVGTSGRAASGDLAVVAGATYRLRGYTLGASIAFPSLHFFGNYEANAHVQGMDARAANALLATGSGTFYAPPPVRLALGVGGDFHKLRVEFDAFYYLAKDTSIRSDMHVESVAVGGAGAASTPSSFDATYQVRSRAVINTSAGGEYFLTRAFSVLGGVSTDFVAAPRLEPSTTLGNFYQTRMNRGALSVGAGSYSDAGSILFGVQASFGWGTVLAVNPYVVPNEYAVANAQTYGLMFILSGSLNVKAVTRAVENVGDLVNAR